MNVLLIVERPGSLAAITRRLEKSGCRCAFAHSYTEAARIAQTESFELILSAIPPRDNAMSSLTEGLAGTSASVFYAHPVEDGCWWLPALRKGLQCFGSPAMRAVEFTSVLDQVVEEAQRSGVSGQKLRPSAILLPGTVSGTEPEESASRHSVAAG